MTCKKHSLTSCRECKTLNCETCGTRWDLQGVQDLEDFSGYCPHHHVQICGICHAANCLSCPVTWVKRGGMKKADVLDRLFDSSVVKK